MKSSYLFYPALLSYLLITSCNSRTYNISFPDKGSETKLAFDKPLLFSEPQKINWVTSSAGNRVLPVIKTYDLSKMPSQPFDVGGIKSLPAPVDTRPLNWNAIPDSLFDTDQLPDSALQAKTYILPLPKRMKASLPELKEKMSPGIYQFSQEQGLPGLRVTSIIQDQEGFIWLIADGKLYRQTPGYLEEFSLINTPYLSRIIQDQSGIIWASSYNHVIYRIDPLAAIQTLISVHAQALFNMLTDHAGYLWIGTFSEGAYRIDWKKQTFKHIQHFTGRKINNSIYDLAEDKEERIWFVGFGGAWVYDTRNKKIKWLNSALGLTHRIIGCITADRLTGNMWLSSASSDTAINIISLREGTIRYIGKKQGVNKMVLKVLEDSRHYHWLTADSNIYILDPELKKIRNIKVSLNQFRSDMGTIIQLKQGPVWIGYIDGGIQIIDPTGPMAEYLDKSRGLAGNSVWGLARDQHQQVWIGGKTEGSQKAGFLNMIDSTGRTIYDLSRLLDTSFNIVPGICKDKDGKIYVAYDSRGIAVFDPARKTISQLGRNQGLTDSSVVLLFEDSRGLIWIGTPGSIFLFDPSTGVISKTGIGSETIKPSPIAMYEDAAGTIWIGTDSSGAFSIDSSRSAIKQVVWDRGLGGKSVFSFNEDERKRLWIATENGVAVLDRSKKKYADLMPSNGLNDTGTYILEKIDNGILIGTRQGLNLFTEVNNHLKDTIETVTWKVTSYDRSNGFYYQDFHLLSLHEPTGKLWMPVDTKTIAVMDPPFEIDSATPRVFISSINLLDKPLVFRNARLSGGALENIDTVWTGDHTKFELAKQTATMNEHTDATDPAFDYTTSSFRLPVNLQLNYDQNYLSFHFDNTNLTGRARNSYRYILEGIDRSWSEASEKTSSENYRNLPPGRYIFKVRGRGINGTWSPAASLDFTIDAPWWKTGWAYLLYGLLSAGLIWSFIQYRSRWLKQENIRLEKIVTERTEALRQSFDELKATQTQLIQSEKMASLGQLTAGIAHEIQNPLNFVNNFSEVNAELIQELKIEKSKVKNERNELLENELLNDIEQNLEKISLHGRRADAIVKGMLQHSRNSTGQKESTNINALAEEYLRLAYQGFRARDKSFNSTLKTDFDESIGKVDLIPQEIGRVFLNLLNNAFYAVNEKKKNQLSLQADYEPAVSVSTKKLVEQAGGGHIEIRIRDNGDGIPKNIADKIFQPFFTTKPTGQGTGLGLSLSYDIIKAQGGEIRLEAQENKGAEFIIVLPINHPL